MSLCECTKRVVFGLILTMLAMPATDAVARPRLRPVRIKDADTLFLPGNVNLNAYPRLNNRNQVVFINNIFSAGKFRSRLWDNGHLYPLGGESAYDRVTARALNDSGEVAGELQYVVNDTTLVHAFVTVGRQIQELQSGTEEVTLAYSINNQGVVTGRSMAPPAGTTTHALRWDGGGRTTIGPLPAHPTDSQHYDSPLYINDLGTLAGNVFLTYSAFSPYHRHGFYGTQGSLTEVEPFAGGYTLYLWDINNQGQMVGESNGVNAVPPGGGYTHAIIVDGGQKKDIHGTIFAASATSRAYAINDSGAAVGWWDGGRGFYHENDTTWLLDSLLVTRAFPGGGSIGSLWEAVDINNSGVILALYNAGGFSPVYPCLLVPADSGTFVNTENDLPDLSPSDGRCYTGNVTALGEDECSFRAAIQHSNAHAGPDTVRFRIPVGGVPLIKVSSPLPTVNAQVYIDAETQPGAKRVEVIPNDSLVTGDGLVISADSCTLRGLLINRFQGSGLVLASADFSRVELCHFGVRADSTTPAGNQVSGVFIQDSDNNRFGDDGSNGNANFIAHNGGPGILIASGSWNNVSYNHTFDNGGLGIDLAPLGVTLNDPFDADVGANGLVNYPYFDSVVNIPGQVRVFGTVTAGTSTLYTIQLYRSDTCDTSGYGEGKSPVASTVVLTPSLQEKAFEMLWADTLAPGQVLTMTAKALGGSTSEFSPCWPPRKKLYLVDGHGDPIAGRTFALAHVAYDPPTFTETFLDSITTDSAGAVDVTSYYENGSLSRGDSIKVGRILERINRAKNPVPEMFKGRIVELDNGGFDSSSHDRTYDELDPEPRQAVRLEHTTLRLNLLVGVEWEADSSYLELLGEAFRRISNYYYDVFDGQVRLDTVAILNNHISYTSADIAVQADNSLRQNAAYGGFYAQAPMKRANVGRRWFGTQDNEPDLSLAEWPLHPEDPTHFRSIAHELGHYVFKLFDEYNFVPQGARCFGVPNYGMMDNQYESGGSLSTELSWDRQYFQSPCRNTQQYLGWGKSCWGVIESEHQTLYDGIYAEILTPAERDLLPAEDYFFGPNEHGSPLQVDVAALTQVKIYRSSPRLHTDVRMQVGSDPLTPAARVKVTTKDQFLWAPMIQGLTSRDGGIRLLGVRPGDSVFANGRALGVLPPGPRAAAVSQETWWSAASELRAWTGDSVALTLSAVSGYLPAMLHLQLNAGDADLGLEYLQPFGAIPNLSYHSDADTIWGSLSTISMSDIAGSYQATLDFADVALDVATVNALDSSSQSFQFSVQMAVGTADSTTPGTRVSTADGSVLVDVDSASNADRVGFATTDYLVIRTGLDSLARQVGKSASVSCYPAPAWSVLALTLRYEDFELEGAMPPFDLEQTVQIFGWNAGSDEWELVGGSVDTALNEVTAILPQAGLYAAFSTGQITDIGDDPQGRVIPETYELAQNHPNPFNPSTTISYYLPRPGRVTLRIYNVLGQTVQTIVDEVRAAGSHDAIWNGRTASGEEAGSGIYFYTLRAGDVVLSRKMVLMK